MKLKSLITPLIIIITLIVFFHSEETASKVIATVDIIVNSLFPAIYPFLLFTSLLIAFGGADFIGYFLQFISRPLFNISGKSTTFIFLAAFSGFPFSAVYGSQLAKEDPANALELQRITNHIFFPSFNFVLITLALALNNKELAAILFISLQLSGFFTLFFTSAFATESKKELLKFAQVKNQVQTKLATTNISKEISTAIIQATTTFIIMSGIIIIFATISMIVKMAVPASIYLYIAPLIEISTGILYFIEHSNNIVLVAIFLGFSSASLLFQAANFIADSPLKFSSFIKARAIQAFLNAFILVILLQLFT